MGQKKFVIRRNQVDAFKAPPVKLCSSKPSCEDLWKNVDDEVKPILATQDPLERNRKISAAYAGMYQRKSEFDWIGLAAIVSRQAGCNMQEAKAKSGDWIGGADAKAAYEGLADANKEIFSNIYPVMRFAELYGAKKLQECSDSGSRRVPPQLLKAVKQLEKGTPEGRTAASDLIADFEQRNIVQEKVYAVEKYKKAFAANERWSSGILGLIGTHFGAKKPALALSSECGKDTPIPLDGSILNADDRVKFYHKLIDQLRSKDAAWRKEIMERIVKQGGAR